LFYNTTKFTLAKHEIVKYGSSSSQCGIIALFKSKQNTDLEKSQDICIAMTHLKAKEGFEEARLEQGCILLEKVNQFIDSSSQIPIIIAGDFNDIPSSKVCQLFQCGKATTSNGTCVVHTFQLDNAYRSYDSSGVEPYTTYKKRETEVVRCIDYIWFSTNSLCLCKCLEIPPISSLKERLPCAEYPSDHLAIMAFFTLRLSN